MTVSDVTPAIFTSCCRVIDTEEVAFRHESHQSDQKASADLPHKPTSIINQARLKKTSCLLMQDRCTQERLWHISLWNTRCNLVRCGAAIKCRNPFESASFASDKSSISIGFSRTAAFFFSTSRKGEKGQTCQTHTHWHKEGAGEPADLTALNVCAQPGSKHQD